MWATSEMVMRTVPDGSCHTRRVQLSAVTAVWPRRQTEVTGQEWPDRVTTALELLVTRKTSSVTGDQDRILGYLGWVLWTAQSLALLSSEPERMRSLDTETLRTRDT